MKKTEKEIHRLNKYYITSRLSEIDKDYLQFEEDLSSEEDVNMLIEAKENNVFFKENPYNSIMMYVIGLTDIFDFEKGRSDTKGGSPPDVDMDMAAFDRDKLVEKIVERWGRKNVANIGTVMRFKPKSLTRKYFSIMEPPEEAPDHVHTAHWKLRGDILDRIPKPVAGKEATLAKTVEAKPELLTEPQYRDWYKFTNQLENMVVSYGIHAAGLVISHFPIADVVPCWANKNSEYITQYDMHETEGLGLIKYDALVINNLDIVKECVRLVEKNHGKKYDMNNMEDFDPKAYALMARGLLAGMFQIETSGSAKKLIQTIKPECIPETSDVSAINRPGPLGAGLDVEYITNKENGHPPPDMPDAIAEILKDSYWTLIYQEQIMALCMLAGYTEQESDSVRRIIGKKKVKELVKHREQFVNGLANAGIDKGYADRLWITIAGDPEDENDFGFAAYCFNKSHSVAYSYTTYMCAYFKANYTPEFFTALMSVRSKVMQPKDWAQKAPEFVAEAKLMDINILAPSVQVSEASFTTVGMDIYFGLNGIKQVGAKAVSSIIKARGDRKFSDIMNFLTRVDRRKVTTLVFKALVYSGAFDKMGYQRQSLIDSCTDMYNYFKLSEEYSQRIVDSEERAIENKLKTEQKEKLDTEMKEAKKLIRTLKKAKQEIPYSIQHIVDRPKRLKEYRARIKEMSDFDLEDVLGKEELEEYKQNIWLRKKPELKLKEEPVMPVIPRHKQVELTVGELMSQANYIGCYLDKHPARALYPETATIISVEERDRVTVTGQVTKLKEIRTKRGDKMAFMQFGDGTKLGEGILFPSVFRRLESKNKIPEEGDIVCLFGRVDKVGDLLTKFIVDKIRIHKQKEVN